MKKISSNWSDLGSWNSIWQKEKKGATFLHPSNQDEVIYGNSTAAMELLEECPELDVILTPVGGGGLIAGTALAAHHFSKNCKVIGGETLIAHLHL